jgi:hypothetical protein
MKKNLSKIITSESETPKLTLGKGLTATGIAFILLLLTITAVLWPLATIWSLNTLFGFKIAYTFWTWLACWILILSLSLTIKNTKKG